MHPSPEDGGRLTAALAPLLSSTGRVVPVPRELAETLWDAFILLGKSASKERHGMLLGRDAWPNVATSAEVTLPLSARFTAARFWLVFWMRERAALVRGDELHGSLAALLDEDDEAVIAINTDTLDTLQSWGGGRRWVTMKRPR